MNANQFDNMKYTIIIIPLVIYFSIFLITLECSEDNDIANKNDTIRYAIFWPIYSVRWFWYNLKVALKE